MKRFTVLVLAGVLCLAVSCGKNDIFRWKNLPEGPALTKAGEQIGILDIPNTEGISHKVRIKKLDQDTFKAT
ncbi:MAG: hypothetical protein IJ840_01960, partial [Bacteroidales bacterium]|nr:hypothetical protein [Bacteroidales bacterium]